MNISREQAAHNIDLLISVNNSSSPHTYMCCTADAEFLHIEALQNYDTYRLHMGGEKITVTGTRVSQCGEFEEHKTRQPLPEDATEQLTRETHLNSRLRTHLNSLLNSRHRMRADWTGNIYR